MPCGETRWLGFGYPVHLIPLFEVARICVPTLLALIPLPCTRHSGTVTHSPGLAPADHHIRLHATLQLDRRNNNGDRTKPYLRYSPDSR